MAGGGVVALGVKTERAAQYKGRMTLAVAMTCLVAAAGGALFGYDIGISENYGATPPATRTPGSRARTIGLTVMLISFSAGMHFDGFVLLLCFVGLLIGTSLVAAGVRMADGPARIVPVVFGGGQALAAFVRRNATAIGGALFGYDIGISQDYGAMPLATRTPGSRATTIGFIVTLLSVSAGMHLGAGGFGLLLCFVGALVGASLVAVGVRMADGPVPVVPVAFNRARSLAAFVRRHAAAVGGAIFCYDISISEDYGTPPPATSTPGRRAMTIGFIVMLLSVSAGMHIGAGGFALLCFAGVLVGASLVGVGVGMADDGPTTPIVPVVFASARALAAFVRRDAIAMGLVVASYAVTMVSVEAHPVLCFATFALLLLGVSLINIGTHGE